MSIEQVQDQYRLTPGQADLLMMFFDADEDAPIALYDLPGEATHRRGSQARSLVEKGLLHKQVGRCSMGVICGVYHIDEAVRSRL